MTVSDDELMIQLQSGNRSAFDELVNRYQSPLVGFFMKNGTEVYLAEDLTQETLLRIYDQAWDYLPVGKFRGWLFRIARNLLIDTVRKRSRDVLVRSIRAKPDDDGDLLQQFTGDFLPPELQARHAELKKLVDDFLEELPEDQRLTFTMHHYSGLTLSEVAEALDTSLSTTKSRLRLAREKLQSHLKPMGISDPSQSD
ncbi:RNA polymerase sigma factor [Calycomorphotria hydatis]|uniref:ECF RNA polymerase sigma factor SigW n=1 Tax=Calycomorphotria hydatis TaxID=2528027 RepID=A0A517T9B0_9PLAN|nr:sigma-70 family RNA polymerase sigma factor [Calycomorphotria hydatis]QDT64953.1 ECF RNA polymerase sigma factor SigW [Calycomorphotria hydatis]